MLSTGPASASLSEGLDFSGLLAPVLWNLKGWELGLKDVMKALYHKDRQSMRLWICLALMAIWFSFDIIFLPAWEHAQFFLVI